MPFFSETAIFLHFSYCENRLSVDGFFLFCFLEEEKLDGEKQHPRREQQKRIHQQVNSQLQSKNQDVGQRICDEKM